MKLFRITFNGSWIIHADFSNGEVYIMAEDMTTAIDKLVAFMANNNIVIKEGFKSVDLIADTENIIFVDRLIV